LTLSAPFPWFGGKASVADLVWERFGDAPNFVEPFFGSGAVLLRRPHFPFDDQCIRRETVNDYDGLVANFWRAVKNDPDAVAHHADWIVSELDLHARGDFLFCKPGAREFVEQVRGDDSFYDAKRAGYWCWFLSNWIGRLPSAKDSGVSRQLTHLSDAGQGVSRQRTHLGNAGMGVSRQLAASAGTCEAASAAIRDWMQRLADRLRYVRVQCGDWSRICGKSVTWNNAKPCAVFLDPPYSAEAGRDNNLYSEECGSVAHDVREWCLAEGRNKDMRIALCGYEGEHNELQLHGWDVVAWKAAGGYAQQGNGAGKDNCRRERIWFSPGCKKPDRQSRLFND
jgi:site-specific DNA-adenine methylase